MDVRTGCGQSDAHKAAKLCDILCTVNTEYRARQDAIITIRLYLAACFGRKWSSASKLRTALRGSKDSTQLDPILLALKLSFNVVHKFSCSWPDTAETCSQKYPNCNYCFLSCSVLWNDGRWYTIIIKVIIIITITIVILIINCNRLSPGGSGYFTCTQNMKLVTNKFKSGGLHEKHVVATWDLRNHLSIWL